jgi:hypothetical protein
MKPVSREDLPGGLAEEIEARLKELHPGVAVRFAGDVGPSPEVAAALGALARRQRQSLREGRCMGCGVRVPGEWPPPPVDGEGRLPEGWAWYGGDDDPAGMLFCPACEEADAV